MSQEIERELGQQSVARRAFTRLTANASIRLLARPLVLLFFGELAWLQQSYKDARVRPLSSQPAFHSSLL